jgi:cob(I)alamin adenosyltransferase
MGLLREEDLLKLIDIKPENVELIMTGRSAPKAVVDRADLVSEMKEVKHYYNEGVLSRKGIEC